MEQIISNPAFDHISETFVQYLDYQSLKSLEFVSQDFNSFVDTSKTIWFNQLKSVQKMFQDETLIQMSVQLENSEIKRIKKFIELVQNCAENTGNSMLEFQDLCDFCETQSDFQSLAFLLVLLQSINYEDAFWIACEYERIEFALSMNIQNIDINKTTEDGKTPLMLACAEGLTKSVEFLLGLPRIKVNAKNVDSLTALDIANQNGHYGVVNLIVSKLMNEDNTKVNVFDCMSPVNDSKSFVFDVLNEM